MVDGLCTKRRTRGVGGKEEYGGLAGIVGGGGLTAEGNLDFGVSASDYQGAI